MDDNEFKGGPDGNGSGSRPGWAERVSLPDHLRPPLPSRRPVDETAGPDGDDFALPVADLDLEAPETAPVEGILPESEVEDGSEAPSPTPRTTPADTVPVSKLVT